MCSWSYCQLIIKQFSRRVLVICLSEVTSLSLRNCIIVRWILTRAFAYDQSRFFVGTLDCLAQSNTGIIPACPKDIYVLYAGKWWELKKKKRMLICKFLKDCIHGQCTCNPVNYFSSLLPSFRRSLWFLILFQKISYDSTVFWFSVCLLLPFFKNMPYFPEELISHLIGF